MPIAAPPRPDLGLLFEVVRADLQREWAAGRRPRARDYAASVPELFADPRTAGELLALERELSAAGVSADTPPPRAGLDLSRESLAHRPDPAGATSYPAVGDVVAGFRLTGELGRGAFGRVYRAEQVGLAGRPVALKVTARASREAQRLAKLRHTNVVPVYSVHDLPGGLQAVCMPLLGRRTLVDLLADSRPAGPAAATVAQAGDGTAGSVPAGPTAAPPAGPLAVPGRPHADRVAWLGARVAAGLAHAHAAGILHLDLKPANVLLADDGEPVLLDFNLSYDRPAGDRGRAGGTLPYMAPEQLDDYRLGGPPRVDERADLFGLGVVLFELLTGRQPFPVPPGRPDLQALAADRRRPPPRVRAANPQVPPAVEAVVLKLLAGRPDDRYPSADAVREDLQRHLDDRPLRYAPNPSLLERAGKWRRRHPRAWVPAALAAALALAAGMGYEADKQAAAARAAAARDQAGALRAELAGLRADLAQVGDADVLADRAAALRRGADLLAGYGLPGDPDWRTRPALADLPAADRAGVQDGLGELALLLAHAEALGRPDPAGWERARGWNRAAEAAFAGRPLPRSVAAQRERLGPDLPPPAGPAADVPGVDLFVRAAESLADGRPADAAAALDDLCGRDPGHFAGQFLLADSRERAAEAARAVERYAVAAALRPADPRPHWHRGRVLLALLRYREAAAALTAALDRRPGVPVVLEARAVARLQSGDPTGAAADLQAALTAGGLPAEVLPLRAEALLAAGDAAGATAARAEAGRHEPATALGFVSRGRLRIPDDPAGAQADFERAAELDPHDPTPWVGIAHVLGDRLGRPADALRAAERAVLLAPDRPTGWASRAVMHARLGERDAAHAAAARAAELGGGPPVRKWLACVYALTSPGHPGDADRAAELLAAAARDGLRPAAWADDPDLRAVRDRADVRKLLGD